MARWSPTHRGFVQRATALPGGPLALLGGERVHQPQGHSGGPVPPQVGDRVQQRHVGAPNQWVTHFGVEGHAGHIHAIQRHLVVE